MKPTHMATHTVSGKPRCCWTVTYVCTKGLIPELYCEIPTLHLCCLGHLPPLRAGSAPWMCNLCSCTGPHVLNNFWIFILHKALMLALVSLLSLPINSLLIFLPTFPLSLIEQLSVHPTNGSWLSPHQYHLRHLKSDHYLSSATDIRPGLLGWVQTCMFMLRCTFRSGVHPF